MEGFDITKYINIALKRRYWIIVPFLVTVLVGLAYSLKIPKIYEARTLILVQPQRVPQNFVQSIVSESVEDRLRTITQQVTSRTNLEQTIEKYKLYNDPESTSNIDSKVALLRKNIKIDVSGRRGETNSFTIAFRAKDPQKVMEVTNALSSNFITENLRIRESQAIGTSTFLADELETVKKRLAGKEEVVKKYREMYMGGLPEQLESNLRILERLQGQSDQLQSNLRDAENRKILVQQDMAEAERTPQTVVIPPSAPGERPTDLESLKNELASLEARYTQNHPDVIRLKEMISKMASESPEGGTEVSPSSGGTTPSSRVDAALRRQHQDIEMEIRDLRSEIVSVKSEIKRYEAKVEDTPKREQDLLSLNRDYENTRELYNSLLNRKLEAEIAVSMEKKQKGEQFRVIDPAKLPTVPVEPDMRKILLLTLVLGLGLGGGLAYLLDMLDSSYKTPEDLEKEIGLPILISMPIRYTEKEIRQKKRKEYLAVASLAVGFILSAAGIVVTIKGVDNTVNFVNNVLSRL